MNKTDTSSDRINHLHKMGCADYLHLTLAAERDALQANLDEAVEVLDELMDIKNNGGPFGCELYYNRVDRAWDRARATIAKLKGETDE